MEISPHQNFVSISSPINISLLNPPPLPPRCRQTVGAPPLPLRHDIGLQKNKLIIDQSIPWTNNLINNSTNRFLDQIQHSQTFIAPTLCNVYETVNSFGEFNQKTRFNRNKIFNPGVLRKSKNKSSFCVNSLSTSHFNCESYTNNVQSPVPFPLVPNAQVIPLSFGDFPISPKPIISTTDSFFAPSSGQCLFSDESPVWSRSANITNSHGRCGMISSKEMSPFSLSQTSECDVKCDLTVKPFCVISSRASSVDLLQSRKMSPKSTFGKLTLTFSRFFKCKFSENELKSGKSCSSSVLNETDRHKSHQLASALSISTKNQDGSGFSGLKFRSFRNIRKYAKISSLSLPCVSSSRKQHSTTDYTEKQNMSNTIFPNLTSSHNSLYPSNNIFSSSNSRFSSLLPYTPLVCDVAHTPYRFHVNPFNNHESISISKSHQNSAVSFSANLSSEIKTIPSVLPTSSIQTGDGIPCKCHRHLWRPAKTNGNLRRALGTRTEQNIVNPMPRIPVSSGTNSLTGFTSQQCYVAETKTRNPVHPSTDSPMNTAFHKSVHHIHHVHVHHHHHHHGPAEVEDLSATTVEGNLSLLCGSIREIPDIPHVYSAYGVRTQPTTTLTNSCSHISTNASTIVAFQKQASTKCSRSICSMSAHHHAPASLTDAVCPNGAEIAVAEAGAAAATVVLARSSAEGPAFKAGHRPPTVGGESSDPEEALHASLSRGIMNRRVQHHHTHHHHHHVHHLNPPDSSPPLPAPLSKHRSSTAPRHHSPRPLRTGSATPGSLLPGSPSNNPGLSAAISHSPSLGTEHKAASFQESMKALRKMGWYWGPLSLTDAEMLLAKRPDGTFLVRDSGHDTFFLSLSFRVRSTTYHTRIEHNQGRFSFLFQSQSHSASTVVGFIEKAVAHSLGGKYHYFLQTNTPGQVPVEVPLLYPLSRFQVAQSLKHLCRFVVLSCVRRDHVARLPLPPGLTGYLLEKQVYWESLEAFREAIRDRPALRFISTCRRGRAPSVESLGTIGESSGRGLNSRKAVGQ